MLEGGRLGCLLICDRPLASFYDTLLLSAMRLPVCGKRRDANILSSIIHVADIFNRNPPLQSPCLADLSSCARAIMSGRRSVSTLVI